LWRSHAPGTFDCEYGFSCMGYEIGGAWGAAMAHTGGDVVSFVGDGSYLMSNSDVYSSVLSGHKMILILCDNGGYAVIQRLQEFKGGVPFNNRYEQGTRRASDFEVDFAAHAASMGAHVERVEDLEGLAGAFQRARAADRTAVIVIRTDPYPWTGGDAWWDVGVPAVSEPEAVRVALAQHDAERQRQRTGVGAWRGGGPLGPPASTWLARRASRSRWSRAACAGPPPPPRRAARRCWRPPRSSAI